MTDYIYLLSIDMGIKNFALWCDRYKLSDIPLANIPIGKRYNQNKESTPEFKNIIRSIGVKGERVFVDKKDFSQYQTNGKEQVVDKKVLIHLTEYLDSIQNVLDNVHYVILEDQMRTNYKAKQIQHHVRAYFHIYYGDFKHVINFAAYNKTKVLGAPKKSEGKNEKIIKTNIKKWSSDYVYSLLTLRKDEEGIKDLFVDKKFSKSDDNSDCCLMILAFIYMHFVDKKKIADRM